MGEQDLISWNPAGRKAAPITASAVLDELLGRLDRYYAFDVAPVTVRDNFPGSGKVISLERPGFYFTANGNADNRLAEFAVERSLNDVRFETADNGDDSAHAQMIACQWWASANQPERHDAQARVGIEFYSHGAFPPFLPAPATGVIQLWQRLDDKTQWGLTAGNGDGVTPAQTVAFTVPGTPPGEGHRVALLTNPHTLTVQAIVDGVVRATLVGAATYPRTSFDGQSPPDTTQVGLFLKTGVVNGGGSQVFAQWTACSVHALGVLGASAVLP